MAKLATRSEKLVASGPNPVALATPQVATSSPVLKIYFITISRLKFAKLLEYFKNKAEAEISKRIDIILCVRASVNTMQSYDITVLSDYTQLPLT